MKVVLFDIDGTILRSGGAGRVAMERALATVFGSTGDAGYMYDGKTDRQIVRELMRAEGLADEAIDVEMEGVLQLYLTELAVELESRRDRVRVFPGVREILDGLEGEASVVLGLLTGNIEAGARAKLAAAGLDASRFRVNAFGSDHESRPELPGIARRRACDLLRSDIGGDRVFVIGDTPADVRCGEGIGARAIAVATGSYTVAELQDHNPWAVFPTLEDTEAVMDRIMNA